MSKRVDDHVLLLIIFLDIFLKRVLEDLKYERLEFDSHQIG